MTQVQAGQTVVTGSGSSSAIAQLQDAVVAYAVSQAVDVDFCEGYEVGYDVEGMYYPHAFAVVRLSLADTEGLCALADKVMADEGYSVDEESCWYRFGIGLNDCTPSHLDTCISFEVVDSESGCEVYSSMIDLDDDEQAAVYARIDEQCRQVLGRGCEDLLAEARDKM